MPTRSGPTRREFPALRGKLVTYTHRGAVRVQKWPRKRGTPTHPHTLYMNAWFSDAMRKIKFVPAEFYDIAIRATKGTGLYPRDLLLAFATKGLIAQPRDDGSIMLPRQLGLYEVAFQGARLQLLNNLAITAGVTTPIPWDDPVMQTTPLWSGSAPTRFTIPSGVNVIRLTGGCRNDNVAGVNARIFITRVAGGTVAEFSSTNAPRGAILADSGPIPVVAGDQFEIQINYSANRNLLSGEATFFTCEILDVLGPTFP